MVCEYFDTNNYEVSYVKPTELYSLDIAIQSHKALYNDL